MHRHLHRLGRIQTPASLTPPSQHPLVKSTALPSPLSLPSRSSQPPLTRAVSPHPPCRQHPHPPPMLQRSLEESSPTSKSVSHSLSLVIQLTIPQEVHLQKMEQDWHVQRNSGPMRRTLEETYAGRTRGMYRRSSDRVTNYILIPYLGGNQLHGTSY